MEIPVFLLSKTLAWSKSNSNFPFMDKMFWCLTFYRSLCPWVKEITQKESFSVKKLSIYFNLCVPTSFDLIFWNICASVSLNLSWTLNVSNFQFLKLFLCLVVLEELKIEFIIQLFGDFKLDNLHSISIRYCNECTKSSFQD